MEIIMTFPFENRNLKTTANADNAKVGSFGYFGNNLASIRKAVTTGRTNLKVVYARLDYVIDENAERRFGCDAGNFSLFYYLEREYNPSRY